MTAALIIVAAVLVFILALGLIISIVLAAVSKHMRAVVEETFRPEEILRQEPDANFFGQSSKGMAQVRGNGALVLTDDCLWSRLALPAREITIPLRDIVSVSTRRSHLGRSCLRPLLYVEFQSNEGDDSVAWVVRDVDAWITAIQRAGGGA